MKTLRLISPLLLSILLCRCDSAQNQLDADSYVLFDITDTMTRVPTADDILSPLDLAGHLYQSARITFSVINDRDVNPATVITLEGQDKWTGNIVIRKAQLATFKSQVRQYLDTATLQNSFQHSIVFNAIAQACNRLAVSHARRTYLTVFSDLQENSIVNFYNPKVIDSLRKFPTMIEKRLLRGNRLSNLKGLTVFLLYRPKSYEDNNRYMEVAAFYKHLLEEHRAIVHITNNTSEL